MVDTSGASEAPRRKTLVDQHLTTSRTEPVIAPVPISSITSINAPHAALLLFYSPTAASAIDVARLESALRATLEHFPHLTGHLRLTTDGDKDNAPVYTTRFRRPWIEYGRPNDPGFLFTVEHRASPLSSVLPAATGQDGVYDAVPMNDPTLAPSIAPALVPENDSRLPVAGLKLTQFEDGGATFCVSASHVLCDAGAVGVFLEHVIAAYHAQPRPPPAALDYRVLDAQAAGDLDTDAADPKLLAVEEQLDVFRYDSWAPHSSAPATIKPPPEVDALDAAQGRPRGDLPRWDTVSGAKGLSYLVEFSPADVDAIYTSAVGSSSEKGTERISRQDAFVGHLWRLLTRARGQKGDELLDCAMACDSRGRLGTLLAPETPGCWNVCLGFNARAGDILGPGGALVAAKRIRAAVNTVRPHTVSAWLHKRAHDLDPTREWIVFPGKYTTCTTNWARCFVDADFGGGGPERAHNPVPAFGGFACILRKPAPSGGRWYEPGIVVALWAEEGAMQRILADPDLRGAGASAL